MFDLSRLAQHQTKSKQTVQKSPLIKFIHEDLIDRLQPISNDFKEILIIRPLIEEILVTALQLKYPNHDLTIMESYDSLPKNKFDLIIFPGGLHWVNDIEGFLNRVNKALRPNGVFMANFPGGGTLQTLRYTLMELEEKHSRPHAAHISPFIKFEHVVPLLQQAGFAENIIDMEVLELEHESPLGLMKMLQNIGESSVLQCSSSYSINKAMYQELKEERPEGFNDHINLISFASSPSKSGIRLKAEHFHNG